MIDADGKMDAKDYAAMLEMMDACLTMADVVCMRICMRGPARLSPADGIRWEQLKIRIATDRTLFTKIEGHNADRDDAKR